jgi:CTP synthase
LKGLDAILVAQVLARGIEGKLQLLICTRENKMPFFGICLGMQMAVIEYSRNVLGYADANSTEM